MQTTAPYYSFYVPQLSLFDPFSLYLWEHFLPSPYVFSNMEPIAKTRIEYKETLEAHQFRVVIRGVKEEDVKVDVDEGNMLHISAKRRQKREEKKDNYHHLEHGIAEFARWLKLPSNVKPEQMKSSADDGVLTVIIPKEKVN